MVINPLVMESEWLIGGLIVISLEIFLGFNGILIISDVHNHWRVMLFVITATVLGEVRNLQSSDSRRDLDQPVVGRLFSPFWRMQTLGRPALWIGVAVAASSGAFAVALTVKTAVQPQRKQQLTPIILETVSSFTDPYENKLWPSVIFGLNGALGFKVWANTRSCIMPLV